MRKQMTPEEQIRTHLNDPGYFDKLVFLEGLSRRNYNGLKSLWKVANITNTHKVAIR